MSKNHIEEYLKSEDTIREFCNVIDTQNYGYYCWVYHHKKASIKTRVLYRLKDLKYIHRPSQHTINFTLKQITKDKQHEI